MYNNNIGSFYNHVARSGTIKQYQKSGLLYRLVINDLNNFIYSSAPEDFYYFT